MSNDSNCAKKCVYCSFVTYAFYKEPEKPLPASIKLFFLFLQYTEVFPFGVFYIHTFHSFHNFGHVVTNTAIRHKHVKSTFLSFAINKEEASGRKKRSGSEGEVFNPRLSGQETEFFNL